MKKNIQKLLIVLMMMLILLTGCLYPKSELAKNQIPNEQQLEMVQQAVKQYKEETDGLVPIKTKDSDSPLYEKYLIDFSLLKETQLLSEIPATAYENGGVYQYVILTPDDDPQVKLIDLRTTEKLREINVKLDIYRSKNMYPPFGPQIEKGVYQINYEKLGFTSEPYVVSPFTRNNLPFVMDETGEVFIDYRIDLREALEQYPHDFKENEDIRTILTDNYPFVPAYSLPYTIKNDEPTFLLRNN